MSRAQSQLRALASVVARSFTMADLTHEQRYPGQIEHTRLAWMVPPLMPTTSIMGDDLTLYLDHPVGVDEDMLHAFWAKTLADMWHKPETLMRGGSYAGLQRLMRTSKMGVRALRFSQPPGYPHQFDMTAGVLFSLEVAHTAYLSQPCKRRLTLDDYVVTTASGKEFGVRAGRPIIDSPWEYDATGEVLEILEQPRGAVSYACMYDQIAQMRSVLHDNPKAFRGDFDGLDSALQALRYLSLGQACPDLATAVQVVPTELPGLRHKEALLYDCIDLMESEDLSDRQKLLALRNNLVPDVLSNNAFRQKVFSSPTFPFTLQRGRADQIREWLRTYYETEIPCNLRRSL